MSEQLSEHEQKQIEELHHKLVGGGTAGATAASVDVCGIWHTIKPRWGIIIKLVSLIPGVGTTIAAALSALAAGLDLFCKGGAHAAAADAGGSSVSADEEQQLQKMHAELFGGGDAVKGASAAAAAPPFCATWKKIKPFWNTILSVIRKIPIIGGKIADILQKLGQALDAICGSK
ncbi:MAG TPA: hypothetical protein VGQ46_13955 [Thermoanaerobaculia bacterium]|jgi:hypothetical protein|nr:hypothetical protein [Thermoanaerobaculia bacterium]